jgi:hypothetical protein
MLLFHSCVGGLSIYALDFCLNTLLGRGYMRIDTRKKEQSINRSSLEDLPGCGVFGGGVGRGWSPGRCYLRASVYISHLNMSVRNYSQDSASKQASNELSGWFLEWA